MIKWLTVAALIMSSNYMAHAYEKDVHFRAQAGVGAVIPANDNVAASPSVEVGFSWLIARHLILGMQVGHAVHFNQKDQPSEVKNAAANPSAYAAKSHHPQPDGDVVIVDNDNIDVNVNVVQTPDPKPKYPVDKSEMNYTWFEPLLGFGWEVGPLFPYITGFYGGTRLTRQDGVVDLGTSYGVGAGLEYALTSHFSIVGEYKFRRIEIIRDGYSGHQIGLNGLYRF